MTIEWVLAKLQETYDLATAAGQYSPAAKSLELIGKHLGMFVERVQHGVDDKLADLLSAARTRVTTQRFEAPQ